MQIGLSTEELTKRTQKKYLITKTMLGRNAPEYTNLAEGDRLALKYLVKAASFLEEAFLKMDDARNIPFRNYLKEEIKKGNPDARMAMKLFKAQKGINAVDTEAVKFSLLKDAEELPGKGLYPADLTVQEFHSILEAMLLDGQAYEVSRILNQRSIVVRDGSRLKAIDYTQAFRKEFRLAADYLNKAAEVSTDSNFNEYLKLQAIALLAGDPMADAFADRKWAELQDTPLEFTITRESYADEMSGTVIENEKLSAMLKARGINPLTKDMIGARVGIVNAKGTEMLLTIKKYLPELAKTMPLADRYVQNISSDSADVKQTMIDADIVTLKGDSGTYRAGITLAENLPNDDKLSLTIGGGRRNVYHRQIRAVSDRKTLQKTLNATLDKKLHQYYENEADHWVTIGHENGHSLGPNSGTEKLGKYRSIIEENKADMISIAMIDRLVELGMYTELQKKQMITVFAFTSILKARPNMSQAHRVRTVMQLYYFLKEGAFTVKKGVLSVDFDKVIPTARKMLTEIIDVQISGDFAKGEKYVLDNFVWTDEIAALAEKKRVINCMLNGTLKEELANSLM